MGSVDVSILKLFKKINMISFYSKLIAPFMISNNYPSLDESLRKLNVLDKDNGKTSLKLNKLVNSEYDLQIIVPVYNSEKTIKDCLYSILNQKTQYSFLLKCIDDGSTDNTPTILDNISKSFSNVSVVHQKNRGYSGARNTGLEKIYSKYIMFIDSDDKLEEHAIERLLDTAFNNDADIVEGSFRCYCEGKLKFKVQHTNKHTNNPFRTLYGYPWGKVYRASLFRNVVYPENYWFEDTVMMYRVWPKCKVVSTLSNFVYYYRDNFNGITHQSKGKLKTIDTLWVTQRLLEDVEISNKSLLNYSDIYDFTLRQFITNTIRLSSLDDTVLKDSFVVNSYLVRKFFRDMKTQNIHLEKLERSLRTNNYKDFLISVFTY